MTENVRDINVEDKRGSGMAHLSATALLCLLAMLCAAFLPSPRGNREGNDSRARGGEASGGTRMRIMSWNVENLFDTVHDAGHNDEEFLPASQRRWTSRRYWQKLDDIAQVIATASGDGGMVDLVGLCEVENDSVLTMLTRRSTLRQLAYKYVMTDCRDMRGIDVALLYQPARFKLLESHNVVIASEEHGLRPTRDLLYVKGLVHTASGFDTLHVVVAHLPSRASGHEGDRNRSLAARRLWQLTDSIERSGNGRKIVVMGDFNAGGRDAIFKRRGRLRLTDDKQSMGTYCFRGYWQWLDHILVSEAVVTEGAAQAIAYPWLLEDNKTYGGKMPRRTFRGPTYHGGISDHLPVLLDIMLK